MYDVHAFRLLIVNVSNVNNLYIIEQKVIETHRNMVPPSFRVPVVNIKIYSKTTCNQMEDPSQKAV